MLNNSESIDLYPQWLASIKSEEAKHAFRYLVGFAAGLARYTGHLQFKGAVRDFRFMDEHGGQPFSFITNQEWLLFYFRPPAVRSGGYTFQMLKELIESAQENPAGEWTVKVRSVEDAIRLVGYLGLE